MTRNELIIREKAVLYAYKYNDFDKAINNVLELFERNKTKKLYRFRLPLSREIDSIRQSNIFLCRPKLYEDEGDCKCIDDVEALVKYTVTERSRDKYKKVRKLFTSEFYDKIVKEVKENQKYIQMKDNVRNMCLIGCMTDKMTDYMWEKYANNHEGICLEYDFEEVLKTLRGQGLIFFPVRYVENRDSDSEIFLGPKEYAEIDDDTLMRRKYILSCMTKNIVPYAKESEWRIFCEYAELPPEKDDGKFFDFLAPKKIYLGKKIDNNIKFKNEIIDMANIRDIEIELL